MAFLWESAAYHNGMPFLPVAALHDPATLAESLGTHGACLIHDFPDPAQTLRLRQSLEALEKSGALNPAQVGRGGGQRLRTTIRGDDTAWLDADSSVAARDYLGALQALRGQLNERLYLGLREQEAHFARYPPGAFYQRHRDQFHGTDTRVLSLVSYLNRDWSDADGGALRLYLPEGALDVLPHAGTSIVFLSSLEHEVLPARRERLSIAAWMRRCAP